MILRVKRNFAEKILGDCQLLKVRKRNQNKRQKSERTYGTAEEMPKH